MFYALLPAHPAPLPSWPVLQGLFMDSVGGEREDEEEKEAYELCAVD